jgi:two-component system capsular synthesis response regulator RcsB
MSLRILIADDHPIVRTGIRLMLEAQPGFDVVAEASNAQQVVDQLHKDACDIVITDLTMPGGDLPDGISLVGAVHQQWPRTKIIVFTTTGSPSILQALLGAGAHAAIHKGGQISELLTAIQTVQSNRIYISRYLKERLAELGTVGTESTAIPSLSPRQADVVRMLFHGMSNVDIADKLGLSPKTVSRQKRTAMEKLAVTSDGELFSIARQLGIIS